MRNSGSSGSVSPIIGACRRRRRNHADVCALGARNALVLAGLQRTQEPRLLCRRDVPDLVEEQRAAIGQLETPGSIGLGVGEGALHVPEHLAFENGLGQAARIHGDE
jgi:hypothetical protein